MKKRLLFIILFVMTAATLSCVSYPYLSQQQRQHLQNSAQYYDGQFHNITDFKSKFGDESALKVFSEFFFNKHPDHFPKQGIPTQPLSASDFASNTDLSFVRLGHSTLLIKLAGRYWLTDPIFSQRASPLQWIGPKRFHQPPITIDQLPEIEAVIISHNHYDHLDKASVLRLEHKVNHYLVPLGVANTLMSWGIAKDKITELDWWQNIQLAGVELIATPAQHFSGRGLWDENKTLWNSWVLMSNKHRLFFSGDTGYFSGFKDIGDKYGPFDLAFLECGAYNVYWRNVHMLPTDAIKAYQDLRGKALIPIHNSTFSLSVHPWYDPFEQISALAKDNHIPLMTPKIGEVVSELNSTPNHWWADYVSAE